MNNGEHTIGLFQGMFEKNILTFNPGWDNFAKPIEDFIDIKNIQKHLKAQGIQLESEANKNTTGPACFTLLDPDGSPILFNQHV